MATIDSIPGDENCPLLEFEVSENLITPCHIFLQTGHFPFSLGFAIISSNSKA